MLVTVLSLLAAFGTIAGIFTPLGRIVAAVMWAHAMRRFGVSDEQVRAFILEAAANTFKARKST